MHNREHNIPFVKQRLGKKSNHDVDNNVHKNKTKSGYFDPVKQSQLVNQDKMTQTILCFVIKRVWVYQLAKTKCFLNCQWASALYI